MIMYPIFGMGSGAHWGRSGGSPDPLTMDNHHRNTGPVSWDHNQCWGIVVDHTQRSEAPLTTLCAPRRPASRSPGHRHRCLGNSFWTRIVIGFPKRDGQDCATAARCRPVSP